MVGFRHPDRGYAFVVTYGRSGSTLLQNILNAIPGVLIRGENNNALFALFRSWQAITQSPDIDRMKREQLVSDASHPWFGAEAIDSDAYRAALCTSFAQTILRPDAGTRIAGFKEIRTIADPARFAAFLDFMQKGFPQARIIFNTRNPDAVCQSSWWRQHDPGDVRQMIAQAEQVFAAHARSHPDTTVSLRYEDYTRAPAALEPLFALMGARPDPTLLQQVLQKRLTHAT